MTAQDDKVTEAVKTEVKRHDKKRTRSFVAIVVVATVVTMIQGYSINAVRNLAETNRTLLRHDADQRAENRDRFAKSDHDLCVAIERLNTAQRQRAIDSYHDLARNLRILHVEITPEIRRAARENRNKTLRRFKARPGGCATLPSTKVKRGPAESPRVVTTGSLP